MDKKILRLAVPSIVSNITVPLLGLVDVAITGHMGEARYMAAIAVGSMLFNVIYWLFAFLRFGTGGMTAQAYGAKKGDECCHILIKALCTCVGMAALITVLQKPIFMMTMWVIAPDESLIETIYSYYNICIWGVLPSLALYACTGWFVGMQNTRLPMMVSIAQNIINIGISFMLVYGMGMKIEGVAMGTVMAQWCGLLMALALMKGYYGKMLEMVTITLDDMKTGWGRFFLVNRILFMRTVFLVAVNLFFISAGAREGSVILAVNSVLMHLFILNTYVMDGFAFAAEALCGKYYGADDRENFMLALKGIWKWGMALTIIYTLVYGVGADGFMQLLTDNMEVRHEARTYLPWAMLIPICGLATYVWDGVFVGITNTKAMLWAACIASLTFFGIYFAFSSSFHNHALWLAFNAYLFMRGAVEQVIYLRHPAWGDARNSERTHYE